MESVMHIVAIGWLYVVLMMAITARSAIAGIMTFLLYGVVPLAIILYLTGSKRRRRNRASMKNYPPASSGESLDASNIDVGAGIANMENAEAGLTGSDSNRQK